MCCRQCWRPCLGLGHQSQSHHVLPMPIEEALKNPWRKKEKEKKVFQNVGESRSKKSSISVRAEIRASLHIPLILNPKRKTKGIKTKPKGKKKKVGGKANQANRIVLESSTRLKAPKIPFPEPVHCTVINWNKGRASGCVVLWKRTKGPVKVESVPNLSQVKQQVIIKAHARWLLM